MILDVINLKKVIDGLPDPERYDGNRYKAVLTDDEEYRNEIIFERLMFTDGSIRWCINMPE